MTATREQIETVETTEQDAKQRLHEAIDALPADALAEEVGRDDLPAVPPDRVADVDGYGNLKLTTTRGAAAALGSGAALRVRVGGAEREAVASDGTFAVAPGQLAFAPGSSGCPLPGGGEVRFVELFLRGGNAWEAFGRPPIGAGVEVVPAGGG